jgi:hypothetical protein
MLTYGTDKVGMVLPWTGTMMLYYNKTMFEEYEVKTPKEYFDEGQWNWDNFMKVMEEMTKDKDDDGEVDTYGLNGDSWGNVVNPWAQNEKGELISVIDEPWLQEFFQIKYTAFNDKISISGKNNIQKNVVYPMFSMQISDCEPYNFEHMFQTIANGNELEVVPAPEWVGDNGEKLATSKVTQACVSLAANTDEREMAVDCLAYLLMCGLDDEYMYFLDPLRRDNYDRYDKKGYAEILQPGVARIKLENLDKCGLTPYYLLEKVQ